MAELELSIRYRTLPMRIGLVTMGALFPLYALVIPLCLGMFLRQIIQMPGSLPVFITAMVIAILAFVPAACILLSAICEDNRISVSKEGLAFPLVLLFSMGTRRERPWSDLTGIKLFASPSNQGCEVLSLYFRSGGHVNLQLNEISKAELEQFLLAIEVWGTNCVRPNQLVDFQNNLQNENKGISHLSYTQMWEEELSRRFNATVFVPLPPGRELQSGRIKIVRQLAFGGLSAIYMAQLDHVDMVIVKEAVVPDSCDEESRNKASEMFEREARFLIELKHSHIARVLDHFAEEGRNYLLLEYIAGQDLRQLVKQNGPQPEEKVLRWAQGICDILSYLHGRNPAIIHRDLAPDNLLLGHDDMVTLIDFGAANEFVGTATGTLVGKQAYIAPEQFRCKAVTQSDIYALGCTLFFLLTGQDPEALSVSHPRDIKPEISSQTDELVAGCTAVDVRERLFSAELVSERISEILSKLVAGVSA